MMARPVHRLRLDVIDVGDAKGKVPLEIDVMRSSMSSALRPL